MGLTWRDVVSSTGIVIILVAYAAYQGGTSLVLISSGWAASAVVLPLAIECAWFAAGDLYVRQQPLPGRIIRRPPRFSGRSGSWQG